MLNHLSFSITGTEILLPLILLVLRHLKNDMSGPVPQFVKHVLSFSLRNKISLVPLGLVFVMALLLTVTTHFYSPIYSLFVQTKI